VGKETTTATKIINKTKSVQHQCTCSVLAEIVYPNTHSEVA